MPASGCWPCATLSRSYTSVTTAARNGANRVPTTKSEMEFLAALGSASRISWTTYWPTIMITNTRT